ncbi:MAG TPA: sulfatase-like hydrolase/transferase [Lacibacter sp.]|nr:sulfatase-like hydrolase/transferase [Lacibacter sp.]
MQQFTRYLILLLWPLYFVLDGYNRFEGFIPFSECVKMLGTLIPAAILIHLLVRIKLKNEKSFLFTWWVLTCYLFFRTILDKIIIHEQLKVLNYAPYYLPFFILLTIAFLFFLIKCKDSITSRFFTFLSVLTTAFVTYEIIKTVIPTTAHNNQPLITSQLNYIPPTNPERPDVYLFVMDEYSGAESLLFYHNYSNQPFTDSLKRKNFFVAENSISNYNLTWISVLSLMQMDYIHNLSDTIKSDVTIYSRAAQAIQKNNVVDFFSAQGYTIINNTFFELKNTHSNPYLVLPVGRRLLLDKTFGNVAREGLFHNIPSNQIQNILNTRFAATHKYNERVRQTFMQTIQKKESPVFMYSHFLLPHLPYLKKPDGSTRNYAEVYKESRKRNNDKGYIENLQYANSMLLQFVDSIQKKSPNAVIIITSDHGNRFVYQKRKRVLDFNNFLAVYKPDGNYTGYSDSTSTVNLFRILLNNTFGQQLPILENKKLDVAKGHL